jgi:hypothetical protein
MSIARTHIHPLVQDTATALNINTSAMLGQSREKKYVEPRRIIAYILFKKSYSKSLIGNLLGGRDHSTIINAIQRHEEYIFTREMDYLEKYRTVCNHLIEEGHDIPDVVLREINSMSINKGKSIQRYLSYHHSLFLTETEYQDLIHHILRNVTADYIATSLNYSYRYLDNENIEVFGERETFRIKLKAGIPEFIKKAK